LSNYSQGVSISFKTLANYLQTLTLTNNVSFYLIALPKKNDYAKTYTH